MSAGLKAIHDQLLAKPPSGATHDSAACPLCAMDAVDTGGTTAHDHPEGGSSMNFTQEQMDAAVKAAVDKAVAEATAPLQSELDALKGQTAEQAQQAAIDAAVKEKDEALAELQSKLDTATLEAANEKKAREDLEAFLTAEKEKLDAKAEADARKDSRIEEIKAAELPFTDEWIDENADRLAAMSDDDWTARLTEWKQLASKEGGGDEIPSQTSLQASRETGGGQGSGGGGKGKGFAISGGALRELRADRAMDPRTL